MRVGIKKVLVWIKRKELRATNVASKTAQRRPRWRIADSDLRAFLSGRSPQRIDAAKTNTDREKAKRQHKLIRESQEYLRSIGAAYS